ncbi:MAG: mechanosensitive ion channel family protein [Candidatus Izemoplasmatales bacterium]|jgi:small conductance mechanosensitive channel|nr:mechanosensitive ion channel family protein [Candidatus Izemoplasmatales bacterium]
MKFKEKSKKEKTRIIIIASIIFVFLFLGIFAPIIAPNSGFANIINNSIGKFFNLSDFFVNNYVILLECLAIIVFIWILDKLMLLVVSIFTRKGHRSETIGNLLKSVVQYLAGIIAIFLILSAWGVQTPTLLAGAGIVGLAISFGAQSLIEDIFSGLFIIFEKQFSVGDVVQLGDFRGVVREIGIRITKFEDLNGDIKIINNSDIRGVINTSASLSPAICDISISYDEDVERVEQIIKENLSAIKENIPQIVEGPFYFGVEKLADSSVVLRVVAKTEELHKRSVLRGLNREMKMLFDKHKISIPFPQIVVHQEKDNQQD